jgi:hypothetical protein
MAPNLASWAAERGLDYDQDSELAEALFAAVQELEHKLADCRLELDLMSRMDDNE